ncbi:CoA-binding protein [Caldiplasma sukawensis]
MEIKKILEDYKNIAVVGISENKERDSYMVSEYLVKHGYNVIPINPKIDYWNGRKSYKNLEEAAKENSIDIVDIFRKPEAVPEIVQESLSVRPKVIWMQLGVASEKGKELAEKNGITVIMDKCIMQEHKKIVGVA